MAIDSSESFLPPPEQLREALREVIDPETGTNIVDLGLVYRIEWVDGVLEVDVTMTSPACPLGDVILSEVDAVLHAELPAHVRADVGLVWSPPWDPSRMSESARRDFGW
ncbi:MAG: metal-sulfur cluster assembly factor [Rhodocyclaceae bacterium]|nr:metal-sulfur cluster assembly factor [Rhodocyclaceae bacterium]